MRCSSNLRQLGLALHSYNDVFGCLPPGRIKAYDPRYAGVNPPCTSLIVDKSLEVSALGLMEEQNVYNAINQSLAIIGGENSTIHAIAIATFACPSDPLAGVGATLTTAPSRNTVCWIQPPWSSRAMLGTSARFRFWHSPFHAMAAPLPPN